MKREIVQRVRAGGSWEEVPTSSEPAGVEATIDRIGALAVGTDEVIGDIELTVRNTTDRDVHLEYGHLIGMLVCPSERTAVSAFEYG